jgi:hypothetical protein
MLFTIDLEIVWILRAQARKVTYGRKTNVEIRPYATDLLSFVYLIDVACASADDPPLAGRRCACGVTPVPRVTNFYDPM